MRQTVQPQVENAVHLLETDLRGLWPQLQDMIETQFVRAGETASPRRMPDFARQRRELLQSIQLTLVERVAGKGVEEQLARMFRETAAWLRVPAGVAAAGGIVTVIAAMSSAAVADVTGMLAASAAVIGTIVAFTQRRKILNAYERKWKRNCSELLKAIEQQLEHAIDLFYKEISAAFQPLAAFCTRSANDTNRSCSRREELQKTFGTLVERGSASGEQGRASGPAPRGSSLLLLLVRRLLDDPLLGSAAWR